LRLKIIQHRFRPSIIGFDTLFMIISFNLVLHHKKTDPILTIEFVINIMSQ
jgi:ABC-type enterochelin transport system permease subunit